MLKIGETITLESLDDNAHKYRCRLVESNGHQLYIDYPINELTGKSAFFMNGTRLKGSFVGQDNSIYLFDTEVVGRMIKEIPMVIISFPGYEKLKRIQRRQFVRIDVNVDVAVHSKQQRFSPFVTLSTDISAGGASIILPNKNQCQAGDELITWFALPMVSGENQFLKLESKLIRVLTDKETGRKRASLQFINPNNNEVQVVTKFCFEKQVSLRKKGIQDIE
ncbi:flagellar brake protein [Litchfieldia salsa]|uniref:C-di-GMP-binding flagellar brake protein YcgR, contains PilZNR and PilZ domains n=1 Tax=Litchfieldia salsa TaxID=930152 RepID=A0A1H0WG07_9BACI|nr:flagellar brake domain-containing protein [Litchfieldia salsa]SDP89481.1 c-di-GMP-binding flagellar brake protein YcgR, contains PilZNR and PilZ domains [Litchfieldia salsa]